MGDSGLDRESSSTDDRIIIVVHFPVNPVYCAVIGKVAEDKVKVIEGAVEENTERRSADMVAAIPETIVDAIADVVVQTPVNPSYIMCRQYAHTVAEEVGTAVEEPCGAAMLNEVSLTRMHSRALFRTTVRSQFSS